MMCILESLQPRMLLLDVVLVDTLCCLLLAALSLDDVSH